MKNYALSELGLKRAIVEEDIEEILEFFIEKENFYANEKISNIEIDKTFLESICYAVDDFNCEENEEIDLIDLNNRLGL